MMPASSASFFAFGTRTECRRCEAAGEGPPTLSPSMCQPARAPGGIRTLDFADDRTIFRVAMREHDVFVIDAHHRPWSG